MTPYELGLFVQNYNEKMQSEQNDKITLAYLGAYWQRVKKMPTLKEVLGAEKKKEQTPEEMLEKVKMLNSMFGGEVSGS